MLVAVPLDLVQELKRYLLTRPVGEAAHLYHRLDVQFQEVVSVPKEDMGYRPLPTEESGVTVTERMRRAASLGERLD